VEEGGAAPRLRSVLTNEPDEPRRDAAAAPAVHHAQREDVDGAVVVKDHAQQAHQVAVLCVLVKMIEITRSRIRFKNTTAKIADCRSRCAGERGQPTKPSSLSVEWFHDNIKHSPGCRTRAAAPPVRL
jgi:hypothetical protein